MTLALAVLTGIFIGYVLGCASCYRRAVAHIRRGTPATVQRDSSAARHASFSRLVDDYLRHHPRRARTWTNTLTVKELAIWSATQAQQPAEPPRPTVM